MATSSVINPSRTQPKTTLGTKNKYTGVHTTVDTSVNQEKYSGGHSIAYTFMNAKPATHVDVRPWQSRTEAQVSRNQLRPLKYDRDRALTAAHEYARRYIVNDIKDEELRIHVSLLADRIEFYEQHYGKVPLGSRLLIYHSLANGPTFNSEYASNWKKSRFNWCQVETEVPTPELTLPGFDFKDYNAIFPPFFLLFWETESDDYLAMKTDYNLPKPEVLQEISDIVAGFSEEWLPDGDFTTPDEVIWHPVSSNAFDGFEKSDPEWILEYDDPAKDYIDTRLVFLRSVAQKRPTEVRDIGILTPQAMRLHRKMMYPLQRACRKIPGCVYGQSLEFIKSIVTELGESNRYFYMRDYIKSGMTIPHEVMKAVFAGFYRRSPELVSAYCSAIDHAVVWIKNEDSLEYYHPKTGLPLGMFVEGYTLLSYACHAYVTSKIGYDLPHNFNNDDAIVASRKKDKLEFYFRVDLELQEDLGMSIGHPKTGISEERFFYCEEYWDSDHILPKDVLTALTILGAKYAINIVHAKELVAASIMSSSHFSMAVRKAISVVQDSYDYEFTPQERHWPYLFGGWMPHYRDGLDSSIEWRNGDLIADCAYWACQVRMRRFNQLQDDPTLAFGRIKQLTLLRKPEDPDDWLALQPIFGKKKTLQQYFSLLARAPRELKRKYHQLYVDRQRCFKDYFTGRKEMPSVLYGWIRRHPNTRIIRGMPGVKYSKVGQITRPVLGMLLKGFDTKLDAMILQGFIAGAHKFKCSSNEKKLHSLGLTEEWQHGWYPMADRGLSMGIFKNQVQGIQEFWFDTKLYIESIDDDDSIIPHSEQMAWTPMPLQWIWRCRDMARKVRNVPPFEFEHIDFWHQMVGAFHNTSFWSLTFEPIEDTDPLETEPIDTDFEDYLRTLLDSIDIGSIRAKVVPLGANRPTMEIQSQGIGGVTTTTLFEIAPGSYVTNLEAINDSGFWDEESPEAAGFGDIFGDV